MPGQRSQYKRGQGSQLPLDFAYGHVQPQAPEVEKAVLGALMIDRDAYMEFSNTTGTFPIVTIKLAK